MLKVVGIISVSYITSWGVGVHIRSPFFLNFRSKNAAYYAIGILSLKA